MKAIDTLLSFQISIHYLISTPYNVRNKYYRLYGYVTGEH